MTLDFWATERTARFGEEGGGSAYRPALATLPNGGYVIGWREGNTLKIKVFNGSGDTDGQVYYVDAGGAASTQNYLELQAVGDDGGFAVTWNVTGTTAFDLKTKVFTPGDNGVLTGGPVRTVAAAFSTSSVSIASMESHDTGYVSTFMQGTSIVFSVHDSTGAVIGSVGSSSIASGSNVRGPEVARVGENKYIVTYWVGDNIYYRAIDTSGAQPAVSGDATRVGPGTVAEVVGLKDAGGVANGGYAVVRHIINSELVYATFYDANGNRMSDEDVLVTDGAWNYNDFMSVTALRGGQVAIVHAGDGPNGTSAKHDYIVLKIVGADGTVRSLDLSTEGSQQEPRLMEMADGRIAVTWVDPTDGLSDLDMVIVDPRTASVTVNGTAGNDIYAGSDYNGNVLNGGDGNDKLIGGKGTDRMNGDAGADTVSYEKSNGGVTVNLAAKSGAGGHAAGDTYDGIENATGSAYGDTLIGDASANYLSGLGGNDVLQGGLGADTLNGGAGNDVYYISDGDTVVETAGNGIDTVIAGINFSLGGLVHLENVTAAGTAGISLTGSDVANTITGNSGNNTLKGEGGHDVIIGGAGADAMYGGSGNDTFYIDHVGDRVYESARGGSDRVYTSVGFTLGSGSEVEAIVATGRANVALTGNAFANSITGNAGANKISGGLGNDVLKGGSGKDVFVFDAKLNKSTNVDKVLDFKSADDSFYLDNKYFTKLGSGTASSPRKLNSDMFVEGSKAKDREDRIIYDQKTGSLYYDADGTGSSAQVKIATIANKTKLYYHDFFVI
ncbi:hypothetical protein GGR34_003367 [Microvirga flocculans]|uniref:Calcium-binding protein n=1 Tax=Microvirga flocculans TaxID=217168 RepID=A0A7W6IHQ2_9HYPH|nr:calcium-binding protein [Microvirga flocculans]MBB4041689.1 hypothetical protein [Microvirga flocculans]